MATKIVNGTVPGSSFRYVVVEKTTNRSTPLFFNYYVTYEDMGVPGTANPSTLKSVLVYQKPGPGGTIQYVESARLQADGTWKLLKDNEARVINPPSPGFPNGSIGGIVDANSTDFVLGAGARRSLVEKGPNTLNTTSRQKLLDAVTKSTPLSRQQVEQAYYISQSTGPNGDPLPPALKPSPDPDPPPVEAPPTSELAAEAPEAESSIGFQNAPAYLRYPLKHTNDQYDFLQIQPAKYVPGISVGAGAADVTRIGLQSVKTRITNTEGFPKIFLPMTPGITESNQVGWGEDSLNPVQAAYGQAAASIIDDPTKVFKNLDTLNETTQGLLNQSGLGKFVTAYFAGQAVSANLLGRSGIVLNPNLELLFQGPKLRSFKYSFRFTPRDDPEAKEIRRIIRTFKKTMAPTKTNLFLGVPCVYLLKYVFKGENGGQDHPYMNKIKPCALVAFDVNYGPDGSYMTYQTGSMTSYTVNMQFDELEPIYNDDIDGNTDSPTMGY